MQRSSNTKHAALMAPRRSLDAMPQHHALQHHPTMLQHHTVPQLHSRPPLTAAQALDYDRPHLSPSPALDRPVLIQSPAIEVQNLTSSSLDYDPRLLDPSSSPLMTPGSRLSLDGGSPSRDSRESSVNSVHSSDDSVIISR